MINNSETFSYFVDDLLSSETNLLKYELDILLMQDLFNSNELEEFKNINNDGNIFVAS